MWRPVSGQRQGVGWGCSVCAAGVARGDTHAWAYEDFSAARSPASLRAGAQHAQVEDS